MKIKELVSQWQSSAGEQRARAKRALLVFAARSEPEKQHLKHELLEWCAQHLGERLLGQCVFQELAFVQVVARARAHAARAPGALLS